MSGTGVLRVIQLFDSSAVVCLDITKLSQTSATGWALAGLGVRSACEIPQAIDAPATSAFENRRERLESDQGWRSNCVEAGQGSHERKRQAAKSDPMRAHVSDALGYYRCDRRSLKESGAMII